VSKTLFSVAGLMALVSTVTIAPAFAQTQRAVPPPFTDRDRAEIQELVTRYARALSACSAEEYADLFAPGTGSFASGVRGDIVGRDKLIALVQSEPHCATTSPGRSPGTIGPTVVVESSAAGVTGRANLGNAGHYDDVYVKTAKGWRFQSRNVITPKEEAARITGRDFIALRRLAGSDQGNFDDVLRDTPVGKRLRSSGVVLTATADGVTGRAYLRNDGGHYDDVYTRSVAGWRFQSRTYVAASEVAGTEASASR